MQCSYFWTWKRGCFVFTDPGEYKWRAYPGHAAETGDDARYHAISGDFFIFQQDSAPTTKTTGTHTTSSRHDLSPGSVGFVAGCSTVDAILALRLLSDLHREFDCPLNAAYLDIKAAFDSVDRLGLWKALRSRGVPDVLLDLIVALHQGTGVQVRQG